MTDQREVPEYRVDVTVRNNLVLQRMESRGIKNVAELCRLVGLSQVTVGALVNLQLSPLCKAYGGDTLETMWRKSVLNLATFFDCLPEDIFPEHMAVLTDNRRSLRIGAEQMYALANATGQERVVDLLEEFDPARLYEEDERVRLVNEAIKHALTDRESLVLRRRFVDDYTHEECAEELGVTRERVRQVEMKALRKLRDNRVLGDKHDLLP